MKRGHRFHRVVVAFSVFLVEWWVVIGMDLLAGEDKLFCRCS